MNKSKISKFIKKWLLFQQDLARNRSGIPKIMSACIVIEISLYQNDRGSFVTGTAGQVTEGSDQVCQLAGRRALGSHGPFEIRVLFTDAVGNGLTKLLTGQILKIIIRQILELEFIGGTGSASSQILP